MNDILRLEEKELSTWSPVPSSVMGARFAPGAPKSAGGSPQPPLGPPEAAPSAYKAGAWEGFLRRYGGRCTSAVEAGRKPTDRPQ